METKAKTFTEMLAGIGGAIAAFFTGLTPIIWILQAVMTIDYITGIICGLMGRSAKTENGGGSSSAAFKGLLKKMLIILVVLLAALLDKAVTLKAGVEFEAVAGFTCLWFIASEGFSILENVATMGVPVPKILLQALEIMKAKGGGEDKKQQKDEILWGADGKKYKLVIEADGGKHWVLAEEEKTGEKQPEGKDPDEEKPPAD